MNILERALKAAFDPPRDDLMDDLIAKLSANEKAAEGVRELSQRLDEELCLNCGPSKTTLRRMSARLRTVRAV